MLVQKLFCRKYGYFFCKQSGKVSAILDSQDQCISNVCQFNKKKHENLSRNYELAAYLEETQSVGQLVTGTHMGAYIEVFAT